MELRPYQRDAVEATLRHFRISNQPACIVLPTGAGKSLVIAELSRLAQGSVIVLCHVKELCRQNFEKYLKVVGEGARETAGIYSAGLGEKDASRAVTFAGVQSAARNFGAFRRDISLVIVDECHRVSGEDGSQYDQILAHFRSTNPEIKLLGLTATPYRLGVGWIYRRHQNGFVRTDEDRPFEICLFELPLRKMIQEGFLTAPRLVDAPVAQYDFSSLVPGERGEFVEREVNALLVSHKRVTQSIVAQIVQTAADEDRKGVMIFAATVAHAREIMSHLPNAEAALIVGETESSERDERVRDFSGGKLRYLVNVAVLTTGFDAPHVDLIAILRPTASVSLYQQIVGRGLRLSPGKSDCLVIDYAGSGFDIYSPEIGEKKPNSGCVVVKVTCPLCEFENEFWGETDEDGRVLEHYGRRCQALVPSDGGESTRCIYRFRFKECGACNAENDIAARSCGSCGAVIVDPDDALKKALRLQDALVLRVSGLTLSAEGERLKLTYFDEDGTSVSERFDFSHLGQRAVFNRVFSRRIASGRSPLELQEASQAIQLEGLLPKPDFVVARKQKGRFKGPVWYRVVERVFDYQGRFRKADEL
jgi:DNA repair protein RadD